MGFFSWVCDKVKKAYNGVKKAVNYVKEKVTNVYNKFTGKDKADEAKRIYNEAKAKFESASKECKDSINGYQTKINEHIKSINNNKLLIKKYLFSELVELLECIKEVEVSRDFSMEVMKRELYTPKAIRTQDEILKIDFDENPITSNLKAIFTLGFWSRKQANESLNEAKTEAARVDVEIEEMRAEVIKIKNMEMALSNIVGYFNKLVELYKVLLERVHASIDYLYIRNMTFTGTAVNGKMSIRSLPLAQIRELEAVVTASKILKVMVETNITDAEYTNMVTKVIDCKAGMDKKVKHFEEVCQAA